MACAGYGDSGSGVWTAMEHILYGLRWAMIVLNEFLPGFAERRREAGESENYNLEKSQKIQLKKAKHYCDSVKTLVSQLTFV